MIRVVIQQPALPKYRVPVFRELARRPGIDLHVVYAETPGLQNAQPDGFSAEFVPIRYIGRFGGGLMWHTPQIMRWHKRCDVAVLSWNLRYANLIPWILAARARGIGTVLWGHGYSKEDAAWRAELRHRVGRLADCVLLYNNSAARSHILRGLRPDRAFVALNALDQSVIQQARENWLERPQDLAAFRRRHGLDCGPVVLFVSRLDPANRLDLLLRAVPQLPANAKVVIIGGGPHETELRTLAVRLNIAERVSFAGPIYEESELAPYFLSSSVFCYPANIGLSMLHALGYGLPVVTSDRLIAQNPEIEALIAGQNGLTYVDGQPDSLAASLNRILGDGDLRSRLGGNAYRTATQDFSLSNMVDGMEAAIHYAAQKRSRQPILATAPGSRKPDRPLRLAIVANANAPYRQHLHLRIARELHEVELWSIFTHDVSNAPWALTAPTEIRPVLFGIDELAEQQGRLTHAFHEYIKGGRIVRWMRDHAVDVVVLLGYNDLGRYRIINWCYHHRLPLLLWGDSNIRGDRSTGPRRVIKNMLLPRLLRKTAAVLACGRVGIAYFERYGVPKEKIHVFTLEPDYSLIGRLPPELVGEVAARYSVDRSHRHIIYSGRLVKEKRVDLLIQAFTRIADNRPEWDLLIVGNGPLRNELGALVPPKLRSRVIWPGFLGDQRYVMALYRLSNVLVLPSDYEPWALVINEAAAAGLAIVASDVVGAAVELVSDGENGRVFQHGNLDSLTTALLQVTEQDTTERMQNASTRVLQRWRQSADPVHGLRHALVSSRIGRVGNL